MATLTGMRGLRAEPITDLGRISGGRTRTALILWYNELARRELTAAEALSRSLRSRCRLILALHTDDLLRATPVLALADAWLLTDRTLDRVGDVVALSQERYCVLPRDFSQDWTRWAARVRRIDRLTDFERRFLARLAQGASNRSIARELGISEDRLRALVRRAMQKLELRNRTEAAVFLWEAGLDQPGAEPTPRHCRNSDPHPSNHPG